MLLEEVIETLGARQHGIITRAQLLGAGITGRVVDRRIACGRLRAVHRGVYRVGPVVSRHAAEMAAVLACGDAAVLSHRSAARLWGILPDATMSGEVEVTVPRRERRRAGIRAYRSRALPRDEVTRIDGIPVTTLSRTLLDLAGIADARELARAAAEAERRDPAEYGRLRALLDRYPRRAGSAALRALLHAAATPSFTRSAAEEQLLTLVRKAQLGSPEVNAVVDGYEVDFLWRAERLIVEVDGFAFHSSRRMFERDRRRDAVLGARGFQIMRVTWGQLKTEPEAVLVRLAQVLVRAGAPRTRT